MWVADKRTGHKWLTCKPKCCQLHGLSFSRMTASTLTLSLIGSMLPQVADYRRQLGVRVSGFDAPKPLKTFAQCGFDPPLMQAIAKAGFQAPTAIQAQALPAALSGRDVLVGGCWLVAGWLSGAQAARALILSLFSCWAGGRFTPDSFFLVFLSSCLLAGHCHDRQRQDGSFCAAHDCSHHGPARAAGGNSIGSGRSSSGSRAHQPLSLSILPRCSLRMRTLHQ